MKYAYFPGCSLKGTGKAYEESLLEVLRALDVEVQEIGDWNCCGATAYMAVDENKAFTLASRNLAIAEKQGGDLMAPCAACYLVLQKTQHYVKDYPKVREAVHRGLGAIGLKYDGKVKVRHPLDILTNDIGLDAIRARVKAPLKGLKVATYYGCQVVRPFATFDHQDYPVTMDRILEAVGAEVVHYPLKTKCCGGSLTGTVTEVGARLCHILRAEAKRQGADLIATLCPLCQFNLDAYQDKQPGQWYEPVKLPVVYFTQLMGLAYGIPGRKLGLGRNIVSATPALRQRQVAIV
jgi:heterodisulfide reductase subunit B2